FVMIRTPVLFHFLRLFPVRKTVVYLSCGVQRYVLFLDLQDFFETFFDFFFLQGPEDYNAVQSERLPFFKNKT
ncbi:MAG: hypothetical protein ACO29U_08960, partial [Crocinitomicaceae bacterium]